jgi:hypothetical protein
MSNIQETLDNFFADLPEKQGELSGCCGAPALGELWLRWGRCSECLEMAEFKEEDEDE